MTKLGLMAGAIASVAAVGFSGEANAAACATAAYSTYLTAGFTCTEGDKTFSGFTYTPDGGGAGITPPASAITVVPEFVALGSFGFTFDGIWTGTGSGNFADSALSYTVTAGPGFSITDSHVSAAASATGMGSFGSVTETLTSGGSTVGNQLASTATTLTPPDLTFTPGFTSLTITKDIEAFPGPGTTSFAEVSSVTDTVSQTAAPVPEPASLALLGSALIGFGVIRRRRRKTA